MKPYLFVDFYKTISFGHLWHQILQPLCKQIQDLIFGEGLQNGIVDDWHRGLLTSEEVNEHISNTLGTDYQSLWEMFVYSSETIGVEMPALELIKKLRGKYTTVLMTDNLDSLSRFTAPAYTFEIVFEKIINSSTVGIRKSDLDGEIFKLVTHDFSKSVLIDDREDICTLFKKLGGTAYRVTSEDTAVTHLQKLISSSVL